MKKIALIFVLALCLTNLARADIRLPDTPKPTPTAKPKPAAKEVRVPFNLRVQYNYTEPVLQIPRQSIKSLRAQLDALDGGETNGATIAGTSAWSSTQTLMSGLFLSLAMIFGGVWFVRGKNFGKIQKTAASALVCLFVGAGAFAVFANVAPPPITVLDGNLFSGQMRGSYRGAVGTVKIELADKDDDRITLIIPHGQDEKNNDE